VACSDRVHLRAVADRLGCRCGSGDFGARLTGAAPRSPGWPAVLALAALLLCPAAAGAGEVTFQADNWTAECKIGDQARAIDGDCSVTGVFQDIDVGSAAGSFALLVALQPPAVAIVGQPFPLNARLRIDTNPGFRCTGTRYCIFSVADPKAIIRELSRGSLVLVDVSTAASTYHASLSTKGFQAALAKIRAEAD
jgi:hypothetical protein